MPLAISVHDAFSQDSIGFELIVLRAEKPKIGQLIRAAVCHGDDVIDVQPPFLAAASAAGSHVRALSPGALKNGVARPCRNGRAAVRAG